MNSNRKRKNNCTYKYLSKISLLIFAILFFVNITDAEYGNDRVQVIGAPDATGFTVEVSDDDGIKYVIAYNWSTTTELEHNAVLPDCPKTYNIHFGRNHYDHPHRYYVVDCQSPPSGGIFEQDAGELDIYRFPPYVRTAYSLSNIGLIVFIGCLAIISMLRFKRII